MSSSDLKGSCYCNAIAFTIRNVTQEQRDSAYFCSCRTCQKTYTDRCFSIKVNRDQLRVDKGEPTIYTDKSTGSGKAAQRAFCPACGSALYSLPGATPEVASIKIGALDHAASFTPTSEIFVESVIPGIATNKDLTGIKHYEGMQAKEVDSY